MMLHYALKCKTFESEEAELFFNDACLCHHCPELCVLVSFSQLPCSGTELNWTEE